MISSINNLIFGLASSDCIFFSPLFITNAFNAAFSYSLVDDLALVNTLAICFSKCFSISTGASSIIAYNGSRIKHIFMMLFRDFSDWFLSSSVESLYRYTASKWIKHSSSHTFLVCSGEWQAIWLIAQAAADFTKSSGTFVRASFKIFIPLVSIIVSAVLGSYAPI